VRSVLALVGVVVAAGLWAGATPAVASAASDVPSPTVTGPITGGSHGFPYDSTVVDLARFGYTEQEFFYSGTARAFTNVGALGSDGRWSVTPSSTAGYETRLLVRRPVNPKRFNGTVIVEWLNVSTGADVGVGWSAALTELLRDGFAWVGVSAQTVGVNGLPPGNPLGNAGALKVWDPARYGSLVHPGDSYSYDIFSQAGRALSHPNGVDPLGSLRVQHLIAAGESQSAARLTTYYDAVQPRANVYDGFLIISRGDGSTPLSQAPQPAIATPRPLAFRSDLRVPVLAYETETDLIFLGYFNSRQPDNPFFRDWEVAGSTHVDLYTLTNVSRDIAKSLPGATMPTCALPLNDGPGHFVQADASQELREWVSGGTPPPVAPRLDVVNAGATKVIVRDSLGNAVGGIRLPQLQVPTAAYSGLGNSGANPFCVLFGTTAPFDAGTLASLYPNHGRYVSRVAGAAIHDVAAELLLPADARQIVEQAAESGIGR
jgi:hypothetical protein